MKENYYNPKMPLTSKVSIFSSLTTPQPQTAKEAERLISEIKEFAEALEKQFISKEKVAEAIGEDETSLEYDENTLPIVWQNANRIRAELRAKLLGERDG